MTKATNIKDLSLNELKEKLKSWGESAFHASQIFHWIYKRRAADFADMSDLPLRLRKRLKENFLLMGLEVQDILRSVDGTEKFLFRLKDNNLIESVVIPAERRITGCISTQVGCKFGCSFCASGLLGFKRDLACAEILEQIVYVTNNSRLGSLTHLVFMGTGEPLDNYGTVLKAIRIINSSDSLHIGARRITISTAGFIPGIERLAQEHLQVELSVSLHAADDTIRSRLMPINKAYPLKDLIGCCRKYIEQTNRQITFEYILMKGINSDLHNAGKLIAIMRSLKLCKINLIPANSVPGCGIEPPNKLDILFFRDSLIKAGIPVTLRRPRGQDIEAACGQLRLRYGKEKK